jgi:hypothetical protein
MDPSLKFDGKGDHLPRQARDKRKENVDKTAGGFSHRVVVGNSKLALQAITLQKQQLLETADGGGGVAKL